MTLIKTKEELLRQKKLDESLTKTSQQQILFNTLNTNLQNAINNNLSSLLVYLKEWSEVEIDIEYLLKDAGYKLDLIYKKYCDVPNMNFIRIILEDEK